jgi:hypothetical protein
MRRAGEAERSGLEVRVHIEALVLDRPVAQLPTLARGIEQELGRLLGEQLPARLTTSGPTAHLGGTLGAASAGSLSDRVALAVHDALTSDGGPR